MKKSDKNVGIKLFLLYLVLKFKNLVQCSFKFISLIPFFDICNIMNSIPHVKELQENFFVYSVGCLRFLQALCKVYDVAVVRPQIPSDVAVGISG